MMPSRADLLNFAVANQFLLFCSEDEFVDIAEAVLSRFGNLSKLPNPAGNARKGEAK